MTTLQISQSRIAVDWLCDVCRKLDVELDKHRSDVHLDLQQKFIKKLQPKHDRSHKTYYLGKVQSPHPRNDCDRPDDRQACNVFNLIQEQHAKRCR